MALGSQNTQHPVDNYERDTFVLRTFYASFSTTICVLFIM